MNRFRIPVTVGAAVIALLSFSCSPGESILSVDDEGNTVIDTEALEEVINETSASSLTVAEEEGLVYMREEEKLARDVYKELFDKWGTNTFKNIGDSEQTHMDAVKTLLDRYGLDDPARGLGIGEFTDEKLQGLHDDLIELGSASEIEALKVGAAIEEIDIIDLQEYLDKTSRQDIEVVYESLMKGSRNHLRSFVSVLKKRGVTYTPQYLSAGQYDDIISSDIERGGR